MSTRGSEKQTLQPRPPRVLIAGGGTGGHVYPGLAIAEALLSLHPEARVWFAGTRRGLEAALVPKAGYELFLIPASGFRGLGAGARLRFVINFIHGFCRSLVLLNRLKPDLVLGTGGYVGAPVLAAARLLRRPTALQEQNAVPGSANRLLSRWAQRIYLGFDEARSYFPKRECVHTGNPVRADFLAAAAPAPTPAWRGERALRVLVFGGSSGAHTINEALKGAAAIWAGRDDMIFRLQTGPRERDDVAAAFAAVPEGSVVVESFILDMPQALRWADLVICRAGAMTLAELAAVGKPAILVPYPYATDDHQLRNAQDIEAAGAAVVIKDSDCDAGSLAAMVAKLMSDPERLQAMGRASAARSRTGAAMEIAADLMRLIGRLPDRKKTEAADVS